MGAFDFLSGTKRPAAGVPALPAPAVIERLLSMNRPSSPWQVISGAAENVDLIAEWKIVDARWYEIFAKASLTPLFSPLLPNWRRYCFCGTFPKVTLGCR